MQRSMVAVVLSPALVCVCVTLPIPNPSAGTRDGGIDEYTWKTVILVVLCLYGVLLIVFYYTTCCCSNGFKEVICFTNVFK